MELLAQHELQTRCPDCACPMEPHRCQSIVIEKCPMCDGIWFDDKQLGVFKRILDRSDLSMIRQIYKMPESDEYLVSLCPNCNETLDEFRYAYNSKVTVKKCHSCRGVWSPINQTLGIIEAAQVSQAIEGDVRGLSLELEKLHHERKKYERFSKTGKHWLEKIWYFNWPL
ncbi:MAG: zf-TFIIB domain-containing protein [Pseudomonadota bacterium]